MGGRPCGAVCSCARHAWGGLASRRALPCPHRLPFAVSPPDASQVHKHDGRQARDCRRVYPPPKLSPKILRQRCPAAGRHTGGNIGVAPRGSRVLPFPGIRDCAGRGVAASACLPAHADVARFVEYVGYRERGGLGVLACPCRAAIRRPCAGILPARRAGRARRAGQAPRARVAHCRPCPTQPPGRGWPMAAHGAQDPDAGPTRGTDRPARSSASRRRRLPAGHP